MQEAVGVKTREYQVSVKRLVEFVLRTGDLASSSGRMPSKVRAQEGSRAHRKLQKSRPAGYDSEIPLSHKLAGAGFTLEIAGRLDGVWTKPEGVLLEEIKTVTSSWDYQADDLHWAQLKIYGWIFCQQQSMAEIDLQLTYFSLETEQVTPFREKLSLQILSEFTEMVTSEYLRWIANYDSWIQLRNNSIQALRFPYADFRKGQRNLCRAVYKAVLNSRNLFIEAPTGTGKTISVLFPTIKALPSVNAVKVFFLTARNTTQQLALKALSDMAGAGLQLRSITLTAKEKVCAFDGKACDVVTCPMAKGYFDRRKPAIREALHCQQITRERIAEIAQRYRVCPHELSLDISEWVDAVICDYNYAFDPRAHLKRHFGDEGGANVLLIDEAHNLVDRAREMYSAELSSAQLSSGKTGSVSSILKKSISAMQRELMKLVGEGEPVTVATELPGPFLRKLETFMERAEQFFAENPGVTIADPLLETYFAINAFLQISEYFGAHYRVIVERCYEDLRIRLFCLDPALCLKETLEGSAGNVFFSATLTPLEHFRIALGGSETDETFRLASPFPPENLQVLITPQIKTSFRHRTGSIDEVCQAIVTFVAGKRGNYLVYFPSYAYLGEVLPGVQLRLPEVEFIVQTSSMGDAARDLFLEGFKVQSEKRMIGFAVMGGIFGEGIDLLGDRLIGVAVIGPGLPQLCLERNLIRNHFDQNGKDGFDYAYLFPGLNRVLQAAGRLIRSEKDRGLVMLVDSRFVEQRIYSLLPEWWTLNVCADEETLRSDVQKFWKQAGR